MGLIDRENGGAVNSDREWEEQGEFGRENKDFSYGHVKCKLMVRYPRDVRMRRGQGAGWTQRGEVRNRKVDL